jgi:hypothetical protein
MYHHQDYEANGDTDNFSSDRVLEHQPLLAKINALEETRVRRNRKPRARLNTELDVFYGAI